MSVLEIEKMNTAERLRTMEHLWDALTHGATNSDDFIDSPSWHHDILKKRKEKITNGEAEFISLSELKKRRNL